MHLMRVVRFSTSTATNKFKNYEIKWFNVVFVVGETYGFVGKSIFRPLPIPFQQEVHRSALEADRRQVLEEKLEYDVLHVFGDFEKHILQVIG